MAEKEKYPFEMTTAELVAELVRFRDQRKSAKFTNYQFDQILDTINKRLVAADANKLKYAVRPPTKGLTVFVVSSVCYAGTPGNLHRRGREDDVVVAMDAQEAIAVVKAARVDAYNSENPHNQVTVFHVERVRPVKELTL